MALVEKARASMPMQGLQTRSQAHEMRAPGTEILLETQDPGSEDITSGLNYMTLDSELGVP